MKSSGVRFRRIAVYLSVAAALAGAAGRLSAFGAESDPVVLYTGGRQVHCRGLREALELSRKQIAKGKKIQLNLSSGKNILSDEKVKIDDSVVLDLKDNKISKVIEVKKGNKTFVFEGKHRGVVGNIDEVIERGGKKLAKIKRGDEK